MNELGDGVEGCPTPPRGARGPAYQCPLWPADWPWVRESIQRLISGRDWGSYHCDVKDQLRSLISERIGHDCVRLCSSGSAAVELALRGCGVRAGDEVITCALDYPGNLRAIRLLDAIPVLVDTVDGGWTIDPEGLIEGASPRTVAVLASHLYGEAARVDQLRSICDRRGWSLIEDVCQMPGTVYQGKPLGSWGDAATFSFGGSKPITSGSGGAVTTSDRRIAQRLSSYIDRPSDVYALSPLQAAALLPQWQRLGDQAATQRRHLRTLLEVCAARTSDWRWLCFLQADTVPVHYKLAIRLESGCETPQTSRRDATVQALLEAGVPAGFPFAVAMGTKRPMDHGRRGRLVNHRNAKRQSDDCFLIDHRVLAGDGSSIPALAEILVTIHDANRFAEMTRR